MFKKFVILLVCSVSLTILCCTKGKEGVKITPIFDKDKNDLSGNVRIEVDKPDPQIYKTSAFIDGKHYGDFTQDPRWSIIDIGTQFFANGPHQIKIESLDYGLKVICSSHVKVVFNNEISSVRIDEGYMSGEDFHFSASSSSSSANYIVEVFDEIEDKTTYSGNFTGNINAAIPPSAFADDSQMYSLIVKDFSGNVKFSGMAGRDYSKDEAGIEEMEVEEANQAK